ncbi:hypothetical protein CERZMDRAFT_100512 [Cercospora zeae-maydis SCOH1-5]|uniref:Uncharacterized protein n=1 Tax=Cercospora zeae-maydis SCOH1-5 TaxID=717836 RepID=A0A6A6F7P2_9PEZI|nr:hypothetical protein CERZMDRAFT_100512 [Cercospora zeae-maydis SCOH1-5]
MPVPIIAKLRIALCFWNHERRTRTPEMGSSYFAELQTSCALQVTWIASTSLSPRPPPPAPDGMVVGLELLMVQQSATSPAQKDAVVRKLPCRRELHADASWLAGAANCHERARRMTSCVGS